MQCVSFDLSVFTRYTNGRLQFSSSSSLCSIQLCIHHLFIPGSYHQSHRLGGPTFIRHPCHSPLTPAIKSIPRAAWSGSDRTGNRHSPISESKVARGTEGTQMPLPVPHIAPSFRASCHSSTCCHAAADIKQYHEAATATSSPSYNNEAKPTGLLTRRGSGRRETVNPTRQRQDAEGAPSSRRYWA